MSLMLKLLSITLLLNSFVYAANISDKVEDFLDDKFMENPRLKSVDVKVSDVVPLSQLKGWNAYIVDVKAYLKSKPKRLIKQRMIWFSNGRIITKELTDMQDGESLTDLVKPPFKDEYYTKENLIFGNADAKHKVAIFSDPLCPFCKGFVPGALDYMKKQPEKFAVYYYHFPLERLHPASVHLVKAAAAAELQGHKNVVEKLYKVHVNSNERDVKKILGAFNKVEGTNLTPKDLNTPAVIKQVNHDYDTANAVMVSGTPTIYLDGKVDNTKQKYLKVK
ncbi:DsbA family protein [Sulfurimonas paralvinellae]|uniref:Disulfide bond formation protein DsbA n=1 Tax=Sulfurimonas paralvinellae TaxID=317658 RepID=A0A7M1B9G7_9BACT|nr:thioredoxin domain-containing protein [Sulfurimonas paralvinellae]QOP45458.1 disulfide bond formation protein DsbA [Sulfurimonas paralvinellae]